MGWPRLFAESRPFGAGARVPAGRIQRLLAEALEHDVMPVPTRVEYDPADLALPEPVLIGKRLKEYLAAQPIRIRPDEEFAGWVRFDGSVESDIFPRIGHRAFGKACGQYYRKPQESLATFEWQHSAIDYRKLLKGGLVSYRAEIEASKRKWAGNKDRLDYLKGMELTMDGIEASVANAVRVCREGAAKEPDAVRKAKLLEMAARCERVPMNPPESFLDAVQSVYFCYNYLADSVGRLDQYLLPYYRADIAKGTLTRERAEEALQELFIYIDAHTSHRSSNYDRSAESQITLGGLTPDGQDGWNELSRLILEADMGIVTKYWCERCFNDPQYLKVDGKPVVVLYDALKINRDLGEGATKRLLDISRDIARRHGHKGIYFVSQTGDRDDATFLKKFPDNGVDAICTYHYSGDWTSRESPKTNGAGDYAHLVKTGPEHWRELYRNSQQGRRPAFWPSLSTSYDDRPWRGEKAHPIANYTPENFRKVCESAKKFGEETGVKMLLTGALDEWGEGEIGYPNHEHGFGILEAIRETFGEKLPEGWPTNYAPEDVGLGPYPTREAKW